MSDEAPITTETEAPSQEDAPSTPETFSIEYVQELQKQASEARNQAGKYRIEKKHAAENARAETVKEYEAKLNETVSGLREELDTASLELQKLKAVLAEGIASEDALDVASLVQGTDEESISESVKRVKSLIGKAPEKARPIDPSQGSGNHVPLNGDPILEKVKRMVGA
jgi:hypothetical protein